MDSLDVFRIVGYLVAGFGGIGAIIYAVIRFSANQIAERLSAKYELKLNKELELFKSNLAGKQYISTTRFDAEFAIYRELSSAFFEMVLSVIGLFPLGIYTTFENKDAREKQEDENYAKASKAFLKAQNTLYENTPFISEKLDIQLKELLQMCNIQVAQFRNRYLIGLEDYVAQNQPEDHQRSKAILENWNKICENMREYLFSLDVVE